MQNVNALAELITSGSEQAWKSKFVMLQMRMQINVDFPTRFPYNWMHLIVRMEMVAVLPQVLSPRLDWDIYIYSLH